MAEGDNNHWSQHIIEQFVKNADKLGFTGTRFSIAIYLGISLGAMAFSAPPVWALAGFVFAVLLDPVTELCRKWMGLRDERREYRETRKFVSQRLLELQRRSEDQAELPFPETVDDNDTEGEKQ